MIQGRRFIICGLNRLALGVIRSLDPGRNEIVLVRGGEGEELLTEVDERVRLVSSPDASAVLAELEPGRAECLLALAEEDLSNLRVAMAAHEVAPELPVVVRTFDASLAESLEEALNIRRAYSVSALSAAAFVSAVLTDELLASLSLVDSQVIICRLAVGADSSLIENTPASIEKDHNVTVLRCHPDPQRVTVDGQLELGGKLVSVLRVARLNHPRPPAHRSATADLGPRESRVRGSNLLGITALSLVSFLVVATFVFAWTLKLDAVDAIYFVVTTATTTGYGDISLKDSPNWVKLFGCLVMLSGGALVAVLFSQITALVTADRLEDQNGRWARRLIGHIILSGFGKTGYRVERILNELGLPCVVLDRQRTAGFLEAMRRRSVILEGDSRLPENLLRAGVENASAVIACTADDLVNLQTSVQARRLNPSVARVTRIEDPRLARAMSSAFGIRAVVSPQEVAVSAFVGAATDERAARRFTVGGVAYLAFRQRSWASISSVATAAWRAEGVRILAMDRAKAYSSSENPQLEMGELFVVTGPEEAVLRLAGRE